MDDLTPIENLILNILISRRRSMSSQKMTEILKECHNITLSRPTVAKHLKSIEDKEYITKSGRNYRIKNLQKVLKNQ